MKVRLVAALSAVVVAGALSSATLFGQADTVEGHKAAAKAASMGGWEWMYNTLCVEALGRVNQPLPAPGPPGPPEGPARETWHAEPLKAFDNMTWLGQTEFSAWAVQGSDGIILMDAIFDYSVKDEVVEGMKKMGLDPSKLKYAVMGHWHGDHAGGAKTLKELYGTKIIMGPGDWDNMEKQAPTYKMAKDVVATDGMKLSVGNETITIYVTPGHTQGTLSSIIPVKDKGQNHTVAYWGGTMYNWIGRTKPNTPVTTPGRAEYVGKTEKFWFTQYAASAQRFKDIAAKAGADVVLSNHTAFDDTKAKFPKLMARKAGEPNPLVIGKDGVAKYLTVVGECAKAGALLTNDK